MHVRGLDIHGAFIGAGHGFGHPVPVHVEEAGADRDVFRGGWIDRFDIAADSGEVARAHAAGLGRRGGRGHKGSDEAVERDEMFEPPPGHNAIR